MLAITEVKHEGECNALLQKIEIEQMKINQKKELSQFAEHIELDQLKACKSLILMAVFRNSYLNVIYLNNSIEDLMEMKLEALKLFNLFIELFARRKGVMKLLKKCLEDLKRLLENMKSQMLYIQGNGALVDGFKGIEKIINGSLFAEIWIQSFILQIERNHITWDQENISKYIEEMEPFFRDIDTIQFYSPDYHIILRQLIN